jgi:Uma2 family endonuclease
MSSAALTSVEEYLRRTEKPNAEYINGVVCVKPLPNKSHSLIQIMLGLLLRRQGVWGLPEVTVRLSETKYLVPDILVDRKEQSPYPTEAVDLCAEILSPDQRLGAMLAKCEQYHAWGVPCCWVIDPERRSAWEYHSGQEPLRVHDHGALTAGDLRVALDELFSELPPPVQ